MSGFGEESVERRHDSRQDRLFSLMRLLDGVRAAAGFDALALADETGCLVAGAGRASLCEELAALAPLVAANDTIPNRMDVLSRRSQVRRLCVDGVEVLLCGHGDELEQRGGLLARAADGCRRILARRPRRVDG